MELFKKLFSNNNDNAVIGLCKFNSAICENTKQETQQKPQKDKSLSEMLKKPI